MIVILWRWNNMGKTYEDYLSKSHEGLLQEAINRQNKLDDALLSNRITPIYIPKDINYIIGYEKPIIDFRQLTRYQNGYRYAYDTIAIIKRSSRGLPLDPFRYSVEKHTLFCVEATDVWMKIITDENNEMPDITKYRDWDHTTNIDNEAAELFGGDYIAITNITDFTFGEIISRLRCSEPGSICISDKLEEGWDLYTIYAQSLKKHRIPKKPKIEGDLTNTICIDDIKDDEEPPF